MTEELERERGGLHREKEERNSFSNPRERKKNGSEWKMAFVALK
jgi:hypothetical protein